MTAANCASSWTSAAPNRSFQIAAIGNCRSPSTSARSRRPLIIAWEQRVRWDRRHEWAVQRPSASKCMKEKSPTSAWRHSTSSTGRMPALTGSAHGWPWGSAVVPVAAVAAALVGSVCIITTHRRCLATRSIRRRFGRSARRTNLNLTARASHSDLQLLFAKAQRHPVLCKQRPVPPSDVGRCSIAPTNLSAWQPCNAVATNGVFIASGSLWSSGWKCVTHPRLRRILHGCPYLDESRGQRRDPAKHEERGGSSQAPRLVIRLELGDPSRAGHGEGGAADRLSGTDTSGRLS